jgi:signal transduction histidine kinase
MLNQREVVLITILLSTFIILFMGVMIVSLFALFKKKRDGYLKEKKLLQAEYEQTILQTRLEIQEQTLRTLSQEIHDNIGQALSLVSLNLNTISTSEPEKLALTHDLIDRAIQDLRDLSKSLNPERVVQVGITEAIQHELRNLEKTGKFKTTFNEAEESFSLSSEKEIVLYRMIQETINNIIKHAKASQIDVTIDKDHISISDNGVGFDVSNTPSSGIGLGNIYQRASMIGIKASIKSSPGNGTCIIFTHKD